MEFGAAAGDAGPVSGCLSTIHSGISVQARKNRTASGMFSQNQVTVTSRASLIYATDL